MSVTIEQGILQGFPHTTILSNKPYVSFLGIPYAKPPVGDLRFKPPVQHPGWSGVLTANVEGNKCMQYDREVHKIVGSEDCLYLNVFVPQDKPDEKKAVMMFIHGGSFNEGSGSIDELSPDYLLDENVIVVVINYRLNILGFLNFDIDECPGNVGLKDQLFAMKWIKSNITAFGGDADNLTIFGESAGSAAVHCHTLSLQSTGFYQKAIMQSGCMFNLWAFQENHREVAFNLAKALGCQNEIDDPQEIVQYLRNIPAADLIQYVANTFKSSAGFDFIPSAESDAVRERFLPAHPKLLAKTANPAVPIISGLNDMEGLILFDKENMSNLHDLPIKTNKIKEILKNQYGEEIINEIKNFYFNESNLENEITKLEYVCHFLTDIYIMKDFYHGLEHFHKHGALTPVYNYKFIFDGEINFFKNFILGSRPTLRKSLKGACHADDLSYLFWGKSSRLAPKANSPEFRMCKAMSKMWTNFAKTGNPNSSNLKVMWNSTKLDDPKYLLLDGDNTRMVDGWFFNSRVKFWKDISKMHLQSDEKI